MKKIISKEAAVDTNSKEPMMRLKGDIGKASIFAYCIAESKKDIIFL